MASPPSKIHDDLPECHLSSQKLIGEYPERLFTDDAAEDAIFEFQMKLKRISKEIEKRNAALEEQYRYFYLHPERVPNSIAIWGSFSVLNGNL